MLSELLTDIFTALDRDSLDAVQLVSRRFRRTVDDHLNGVCKRRITTVAFGTHGTSQGVYECAIGLPYDTRDGLMLTECDADIAVIVNYLHSRMRHAYVEFFIARGRIPAEGFELFLNLPSLGPLHSLTLRDPSCWQLGSGLIHRFAFHFETLDVFRLDNGTYSKSQISGQFLRECADRDVLEIELQSVFIVVHEFFDVTEEDICVFLFGKPGTPKRRRLSLNRVQISEDFLQRLESQRSTVTDDISLDVSPAPKQNYHAYATNVKQAEFGMLADFPGDIRLQFTLIAETLHMRRGDGRKREERFFFVADE